MTTPNPTPTTRERDDIQKAALEVVERLGNTRGNILWVKRSAEIIAAALARERREAEHEQMERDCKAVCMYCAGGHKVHEKEDDVVHWHYIGGQWAECDADIIRVSYSAAIEAMRE